MAKSPLPNVECIENHMPLLGWLQGDTQTRRAPGVEKSSEVNIHKMISMITGPAYSPC